MITFNNGIVPMKQTRLHTLEIQHSYYQQIFNHPVVFVSRSSSNILAVVRYTQGVPRTPFLTILLDLTLARPHTSETERVSSSRHARPTNTHRVLDIVSVARHSLAPTPSGIRDPANQHISNSIITVTFQSDDPLTSRRRSPRLCSHSIRSRSQTHPHSRPPSALALAPCD